MLCCIVECMLFGCWGMIDEVVEVILFLCLFGVLFVIGLVVLVDGGYLMV